MTGCGLLCAWRSGPQHDAGVGNRLLAFVNQMPNATLNFSNLELGVVPGSKIAVYPQVPNAAIGIGLVGVLGCGRQRR